MHASVFGFVCFFRGSFFFFGIVKPKLVFQVEASSKDSSLIFTVWFIQGFLPHWSALRSYPLKNHNFFSTDSLRVVEVS